MKRGFKVSEELFIWNFILYTSYSKNNCDLILDQQTSHFPVADIDSRTYFYWKMCTTINSTTKYEVCAVVRFFTTKQYSAIATYRRLLCASFEQKTELIVVCPCQGWVLSHFINLKVWMKKMWYQWLNFLMSMKINI